MSTVDAVSYFGSKVAIAKALGINKSAVTNWGKSVPTLRAYQLQVLTKGALKVTQQPQH